ncbi:ATP-binding cassette domain-containing protein [Enterococcus cecorum]|uniref:ATP-binding cassette domain-containing protein n=1 Tax=Enterococcus cecorum TaxID=44008 RepID=UPI00148D7C2F|nr:ABC transporter ATP-binding protein [Enterococcus cecorum]
MIELKNVSKQYENQVVLKHINLKIASGELVCLVGPSGSGKTTLIKMLNRLLDASSGEILLDGKNILKQAIIPLRLNMGYVLQQIALFPHMTIFENITLMLELKKIPKNQWLPLAKEWLTKVDLDPEKFLSRYPHELSGGQQQRIGIVRALISSPKILLMDEPFSALDPLNRRQLQDLIKQLQQELGLTIIFVTHDMSEAKRIADKIALLHEGKLVQYDTVESLIQHPKNEWVAQFLQGSESRE